jgi:hypothetical protein
MKRKQDWKLFSEDMEDEPDSARELSFRPGDGKIRKKPESLLGFLDVDCDMKEGELKSILKPTAYSCITDESKLNGTMQVQVPTASFLVPNPAVGPTSNYMSVPGVSPPTPPVFNPGAPQASLGPTSFQDSQGASAAYASSQATPPAFSSSQSVPIAYTSSQATPAAYASSQTMPTAYASSQATPAYASTQVTSSQATSFSSGLQAPEFGAAFDAGYQFPGLSFTTRGNSEPDQ